MDAISYYTLSSATWYLVQAIPLLVSPSSVVSLLDNGDATAANPSGLYLASLRLLAMLLILVALSSLYLNGMILSSSSRATGPLLSLTIFTTTCAFVYAYTSYNAYSNLAYLPAVLTNGNLAAWGIWCGLFKTGNAGDEARGSSWLFSNQEKRARKIEKREKKWAKVDKVK